MKAIAGLAKAFTRFMGGDVNPGYGYRNFVGYGGEKWPFGISGTGQTMVQNHRVIRENARTAMHDSLEARAVVERTVDTVVDTGLKLKPEPMVDVLGITDDKAQEFVTAVHYLTPFI